MMRKAVLSAALAAGFCVSSWAGWEYTAVTKSEGRRGDSSGNGVVKGLINGGNARLEFIESANPTMPKGAYILMKGDTKTMYMVNPSEKTYTVWDMDAMMGMAGAAMRMGNIKFTDPKVETLLEENGGTIAGYPTTHYRFRTTYGTEMSFMGMNRASQVTQDEDVWSTTKLNAAGMDVWLKMQGGFKSGNEQLDNLMKAQREKAKGFPLKRVVVQTTKDASGRDQTVTTTTEVTELKETNPGDAAFQIPAGYKEQQMMAPMNMNEAFSNQVEEKTAPAGEAPANPFLRMMQKRMQQRSAPEQ